MIRSSTPRARALPARSVFLTGLVLLGAAGSAVRTADGQARADSARAPAAVKGDSALAGGPAVVRYGPDTLFTLRGSLGPYTPEARARAIEARLKRLGPGLATGRDTITVVDLAEGPGLFVNDEFLVAVLSGDVVPPGRSRVAVGAAWALRIREVTAEVDRAESAASLLVDAGKALGVTLLLVLLLLLLRRVAKRLYAWLAGPGVPSLHIKQFEVLAARRVGEVLTGVAKAARVVLTVIVLYVYVPLVLSFFPWTARYSRRIAGYVADPLMSVGSAIIAYLPKLFFVALIVLVARYVLRLIQLFFTALGSGALAFEGFHRSWARPTYKIVRILVLAFAAVVMFPYLPGAGSEGFKGVSIFLGVLLSLGSTVAVGNIVAGVVLTYTSAFEIGDRVQIGETVGDVLECTMLVTRLRTIKHVDVTIPNLTVLSSQVQNFTTEAKKIGLILHTTVTIGYDWPWRRIHELLVSAAAATPNVLKDPKPFVLQTSLDDFYVSYQINAYTDDASAMMATYSRLHENIQDAFFNAGVEIMSPHYLSARDGNAPAIPADKVPKGFKVPAFRVETGPREG